MYVVPDTIPVPAIGDASVTLYAAMEDLMKRKQRQEITTAMSVVTTFAVTDVSFSQMRATNAQAFDRMPSVKDMKTR